LSLQASSADDGRIHAKFSFVNPSATEVGFKRDLDVCLRKSTSLYFHIRAPGGGDFMHDTPRTLDYGKRDPRQFLACMQEKSYRVDPRGNFQTGWIAFWPDKRDASL
jgi:hypothetical protein